MTRIQLRHDTATNWTTANPILAEGEVGVETDTNKFKIGDGVTAWSELAYQGSNVDLSNYYTKTQTDELLEDKADDFVVANPITLETPVTSSLSFYTYDKGSVNYNYETGEYYYGFAEDRTMFEIVIDIPEDINIDVYSDYWKVADSSLSFSRKQPNNTANCAVFEIYANNGTEDVVVSRLWYGSSHYRLGNTTNYVSSPFGESLGTHQANDNTVLMKSGAPVSQGYESNIVSGSRLSKIKLFCMCQCTGSWGADFSSASWGNYWSDSTGARLKSLKLYTSSSDTEGTELIRYAIAKPTLTLNIDNTLEVDSNGSLGINTNDYYNKTQVDTLLNNKVGSFVSLFDCKWADHKLNEISWLEASTFSWQSGDVYTSAYNHLVQDIQGITAETETIGSYTVTFYRATDGHKVCLADQETTIANIYSETGIAWYYILDTTNTQFKLPRTKYGFEGLRTNVGDKIDESLPNITGNISSVAYTTQTNGALIIDSLGSYNQSGSSASLKGSTLIKFDASNSNSTYQNNAPVQERATQMYLYFYVGDYSQTAIEQTAGLNSELFNGKADVDLSNCTKPHIVETYQNGASWYRVYSDGWCEQGGFQTSSGVQYYLKPFRDNNYTLISKGQSTYSTLNSPTGTSIRQNYTQTISSYDSTSFTTDYDNNWKMWWQACGYIR